MKSLKDMTLIHTGKHHRTYCDNTTHWVYVPKYDKWIEAEKHSHCYTDKLNKSVDGRRKRG